MKFYDSQWAECLEFYLWTKSKIGLDSVHQIQSVVTWNILTLLLLQEVWWFGWIEIHNQTMGKKFKSKKISVKTE